MEDSCVGNMYILSEAFDEMQGMIQQNFKLTEEKRRKFMESNTSMMTLREELEVMHQEN